MMKFTRLVLVFLCVFTLAPSAAWSAESTITCNRIPILTQYFLHTHVATHNHTDQVSERATEQMIKRLDPSKYLLLQSDIEDIKPKILSFYKKIREPKCNDIEPIKDLLVTRAKEQLAYAKEALGDKYKLDENVELLLDSDKRKFAKDKEEAKKNQLIQIHFQVSNYLLTDMKLAEAKQKLIHRYALNVTRLEKLKQTEMYEFLVDSFANSLDPHSSYLGPEATEEFQMGMRLSLEGIGASLSNDDGYTVIQELIPGGAALRSNQLQPKDKIIAVGQGKEEPMENVIDMDLRDVVRKIRGPSGTTVRLTVLREKPEVQRFTIPLVRTKVQLEDEAAKVEFFDKTVDGKKMKLARIDLPGFYGGQRRSERSSFNDVAKAVEKAKEGGAEGILFDLSTNGGGLLDEAVKIAGLFINEGNIVATKDSNGSIEKLDDVDPKIQFAGPMVVLVSRLSASASEIFAGALQDYKRAVIVGGDHTYGKGSVQAVLPLPNDEGILKVTTGLFFLPGGNSTQHRGVTSDVSFPSIYSTDDIGEQHLDYSLNPDAIPAFLSPNANIKDAWKPVAAAEVEKLKTLSKARVEKSKEFSEILKDLKENEGRKGVIKLSKMRDKEAESKKKTKDKAPKQLVKERKQPQIDEAISILADFVNLRKSG